MYTTRHISGYYAVYMLPPCRTLYIPVWGSSQDGILDPFPYTLLEGFGGFLKYLLMPEYTGIDMECMVYVTSVG